MKKRGLGHDESAAAAAAQEDCEETAGFDVVIVAVAGNSGVVNVQVI